MEINTMKEKGRPAEILLVEDNEGDIILTVEAFKAAKIANNITVASDGEIALQILNREPPYENAKQPDMILLDLNLPKLDGREVLERVKANPRLRLIPVIIVTSSRAEIDVVKSYDLHANAFVTKPLSLKTFEEIVSALASFWFEVVVIPESEAS